MEPYVAPFYPLACLANMIYDVSVKGTHQSWADIQIAVAPPVPDGPRLRVLPTRLSE